MTLGQFRWVQNRCKIRVSRGNSLARGASTLSITTPSARTVRSPLRPPLPGTQTAAAVRAIRRRDKLGGLRHKYQSLCVKRDPNNGTLQAKPAH